MSRFPLFPILVAAFLAGCAARTEAPTPEPVPDPVPDDEPMTEADVRAFLGLDAETRAFLEAQRDEERAAEEADRIDTDDEGRVPIAAADFDIPIHINERVEFWMDYFQDDENRERFTGYLERMGRYGPYIRLALRERGMPEDLIYLALIESGFNTTARSHAAAVGIWQFIAGTGRRYGLEVSSYVDERRDPIEATRAALDYLEMLHERFGSWYLAAAAYNSGENRVERILRRYADGARGDDALFWEIDQYLPRETRHYVPKLIAAAILAKHADRYGFNGYSPEPPLEFDVVSVPDATDFAVIAEAAGVDDDEIARLNPQFVKRVTPPGREAEVRVPAGRGPAFTVAYAKIPPSRRVQVLEHTVRRGETLSHIARRYGTTVRAIQDANRLRNPHAIRAGQALIVRMGPGAAAAGGASSAGSSRASAAPTARPADGDATRYVVRRGDSLWSIARRHNVSVDDLRAWNDIDSGNRILPGQELVVGSQARVIIHRVQAGDTVWGIARRYGISVSDLIEWNRLGSDAIIRPGDRVEVPVGG